MEVLRADGAESWRRVCSDTFVPLDAVTGDDFTGQIEHVRMNGVSVSRVTCTPCVVGRSPRTIRSAPRSDVLLNLVDTGSTTVRTGDREEVLAAGRAALYEADVEYHLDIRAPVVVLTLQLDRALLPVADSRIRAAHGELLGSTARIAVLQHFMRGVLAGGSLGLEGPAQYGLIARDLLLLALHERDDVEAALDVDSGYVMVRTFLERHFTDVDLTVDQVTRRLRVSRRYVEGVFARHGLSPATYLRSLRLTRAQALLAGTSNVSVGDAARLSGFSDPATFTRAFRRATGLTPSAWRQHQRNELDPATSAVG